MRLGRVAMTLELKGKREPGTPLRRFTRWAALVAGVGGVSALLGGFVLYTALGGDIPNFESFADYRPKTVTRVFAQDGQLIGEFFREKRIVIPYERIPRRLVQAVLASEDDRFFDHSGIDYVGILRAAVANLRAGRVVQGGSTITQQVAKSLLVQAEGYKEGTAKKLSRKVKEAILARRLEKSLKKEEILALYLNQIFLGNHAYGVQAAAENYFRKNVEELNVAEMALIAGLPQAPSRYSPFRHPEKAKNRRIYVLRRMLEEGFITDAELAEAENTAITVYEAPNTSRDVTPYFTEHVRRELVGKYGEDALLDEGLRVWTTVDVERYRAAEDATYEHLRLVDKRQGYRGALVHLESEVERDEFLERYSRELARRGRLEKLENGELHPAVVTAIERDKQLIRVQIGPHSAVLPQAALRWARAVDPQAWFDASLLREIPKTFRVGDVLHVRTTTIKDLKRDAIAAGAVGQVATHEGEPAVQLVMLEQEPNLESALLSIDVESGYVLAMIGGYSFDRSEFNRAIQACRQPGSSFKPIVYAAAIDLADFTPSTTVIDAPLVANDPSAGIRWKPKNFAEEFLGEVTVRTALQNSMNVPAIKVLDAVGVGPAIEFAKRVGITTELPPELGLALGSGCVTMGDLLEVYRLFAGYGKRGPRRFVTRVVDRDGRALYDDAWHADGWIDLGRKVERALHHVRNPPERILDERSGYLITKLMRNVVLGGTGAMAQRLGIPVAGKTGTTNDSFDAWFVGFTTEIATAAWVGYDDYVLPMGRYEQGGRAALPIWLDYMAKATKGKITPEFPPPPGIVMVRIDPKTGHRARGDTIGAVYEAYKAGTEPADYVGEAGAARVDEFGKTDF